MTDPSIPEEWRPIADFPGYEVSSLGRVKSMSRTIMRNNGWPMTFRERILKPGTNKKGYLVVHLQVTAVGVNQTVPIHILVCTAFNGFKPSSAHEVAHDDGNKTNNVPSNLFWKTSKENSADRERHGHTARGETHGQSILTAEQALEIRRLFEDGLSGGKIAAKFGINRATAFAIKYRYSWKHI